MSLPLASILALTFNAGTYAPHAHLRFYEGPDRDFVGEGVDLSGVGRGDDGDGTFSKWATMVSGRGFVTANHFFPANGTSIRFWTGTGTNEFETATVQTSAALVDDLRVGWLTAAPSPAVRRYPLFTLPYPTNYCGAALYYVGKQGALQGDFSLGWQQCPPGGYAPGGTNTLWSYSGFLTPIGGTNFVFGAGGDSGAPTFALAGGRLALFGTHYTPGWDSLFCLHADLVDERLDAWGGEAVTRAGVGYGAVAYTSGGSLVWHTTSATRVRVRYLTRLGLWANLEAVTGTTWSATQSLAVPAAARYQVRIRPLFD